MECLDVDALAAVLSPARAGAMEDVDLHLDACSQCRELVAAFVRASDPSSDASAPTLMESTLPSAPRAAHAEELRVGQLLADRYALERVVGEGGMGVVWAARDTHSGGRVAIKTLKKETVELCRRVEREAYVARAISHPNVVEVRAVLPLASGAPALVMDLLEGRSLAAELAVRGRLDPVDACAVLSPVVSAVRAAHAKGFVHRDLKPQNVFLATADDADRPVVMLLDFGLARAVARDDAAADKLTQTGAVLGTPHYMAPEQLFGEADIDARADVWSLGAIAYECLTGARPWSGKSYAQLVKAATRGAPAPLASHGRDVPAALAAIVDAMLAADRASRPPLAEVHAILDAVWRGEAA
ncbi:MAG: serine/threonine-protein kinase [Polyangiaceae bacterium]